MCDGDDGIEVKSDNVREKPRDIWHYNVKELREELERLGASPVGLKRDMIKRIKRIREAQAANTVADGESPPKTRRGAGATRLEHPDQPSGSCSSASDNDEGRPAALAGLPVDSTAATASIVPTAAESAYPWSLRAQHQPSHAKPGPRKRGEHSGDESWDDDVSLPAKHPPGTVQQHLQPPRRSSNKYHSSSDEARCSTARRLSGLQNTYDDNAIKAERHRHKENEYISLGEHASIIRSLTKQYKGQIADARHDVVRLRHEIESKDDVIASLRHALAEKADIVRSFESMQKQFMPMREAVEQWQALQTLTALRTSPPRDVGS